MKYHIINSQIPGSGRSYILYNESGLIEGEFYNEQEARQAKAELEGVEYTGFNVRSDLQHLPVEALRTIQKNSSLGYACAVLNVNGDLNIGNLIRSAVIFGCDKFYIFGKRRYDKRSTVGAQNYIDIEFIDWCDKDASEIVLDVITQDGYIPVAIEQDSPSICNYSAFKFINKPCVILGSESNGLPADMLEMVYHRMSIPQAGIMRSLNVASAGAIVMYECMRQKANL